MASVMQVDRNSGIKSMISGVVNLAGLPFQNRGMGDLRD